MAVLGAGAGFGVVLHREDRLAVDRKAGVGAIEQGHVGLGDASGQAVGIHGETVVHRGDLDFAGGQILDRVIGTVMALMHLGGLAAQGQAHELVTKADAEHGFAGFHELLNGRDGVSAGLGRIAGAVGEEDRIGIVGQDVVCRSSGGHDGDLGTLIGEAAQNVALGAVIDGDDVEFWVFQRAVADIPLPAGLVPVIGLGSGDFLGEVKTFKAGEGVEFGGNGAFVELAGRLMDDDAIGHALFADQCGQGPSVDASDADDVALLEPGIELFGSAVVGRVGNVGLEHDAADAREGGHVHRLDVVVIGADIADMGKGEGDDLPGIGGVGEHFLITGHGGVETHFTSGVANSAEAVTLKAGAVRQNQNCGRGGLLPAGHFGSPSSVCRGARHEWWRGGLPTAVAMMSVEASS